MTINLILFSCISLSFLFFYVHSFISEQPAGNDGTASFDFVYLASNDFLVVVVVVMVMAHTGEV